MTEVHFHATKKGLLVQYAGTTQWLKSANLTMTNLALPVGNHLRTLNVLCTHIETGWTVTGVTGQGIYSRIFFPKNLSQSDILITGVAPDQSSYDHMLAFVQAAQWTAVQPGNDPNSANVNMVLGPQFADKSLPGPDVISRNPGFSYSGFPIAVDAGHGQFQFAKPFQMTFKISYDYLPGSSVLKTATVLAAQAERDTNGVGDLKGLNDYDYSYGGYYSPSANKPTVVSTPTTNLADDPGVDIAAVGTVNDASAQTIAVQDDGDTYLQFLGSDTSVFDS